jgi:hypothetical protein
MTGWRLFRAKLRERPWAALGGLLADYLTFVAMVVFFVLLWGLRRPISLVERVSGRAVRATIIDAIARVAHG